MTKHIAILIEDLFQDAEVIYPYYAFQAAGYTVELIGREKLEYTGKYGYPMQASRLAKDISADEFDAVIIPGGFAPDLMRKDRTMIDFVKAMFSQNKVVAAICHGPWILASAGILQGKKATCYYAIADDITNAGAMYSDEAVVVDGNVITSRKPDDLPEFCKAIFLALQN